MTKALRFSPLAKADLGEIWTYSFENWSRKQADTYCGNINKTCKDPASGKKQARPSEVLPEYKKYNCGSHVIYYTESAQHCDIVRILHQRQDAARHLH